MKALFGHARFWGRGTSPQVTVEMGGQTCHRPLCAGLSTPRAHPLDVILFTQFVGEIIGGKPEKRSGHPLITNSSFLLR